MPAVYACVLQASNCIAPTKSLRGFADFPASSGVHQVWVKISPLAVSTAALRVQASAVLSQEALPVWDRSHTTRDQCCRQHTQLIYCYSHIECQIVL